jgi:hypothetical protein
MAPPLNRPGVQSRGRVAAPDVHSREIVGRRRPPGSKPGGLYFVVCKNDQTLFDSAISLEKVSG